MSAPHVLLVVVDQMAHDAVAALGHPTVVTPHLDELVGRGVTFTDAYCSAPLCLPSRTSLMTGRLARRHGVYDNGSELGASVTTFAHHLNRAGYTTVLAGKMHFVGPDQRHGFAERLTTDLSPTGFDLTPDWGAGPVANPGTSVARLRYPPVQPWSRQLSYDEEVLHRSLARLRLLSREGRPFLLVASFSHPHDPFVVPQEYWDRLAGREVEPPRAPAVPQEERHPFNRWIQVHHEVDRLPLSLDETLRARRAYYAALGYVDDLLGRLVGEVRRLGLQDDTVVIFTSDHGEMLGEHGMWFKRTFYDGAAKVPLVVAVPGVAPAVRAGPVSLMDVTATLLHLAQAPDAAEHVAGMDGASLLPLVTGDGDAADRPAEVVAEYLAEGTVEPLLMVRDATHKYVEVRGHAPQLFDLRDDPLEMRDRAGDPSLAEVESRLRARLLADVDLDALAAAVVHSQQERLLTLSGTPPAARWPEPPPTVPAPYPSPTP